MSLEQLFEVEWGTDPEAEMVVGPEGREGAHIGGGEGIVKGDKISGRIRFSFYTGECPFDPGFLAEQGKRFEDIKDHICTINPAGIIDTDDGAAIQFDVKGFGLRLEKRVPLWSLTGGVRFFTGDERYRWVNELLGVWQGEFDESTGTARYAILERRPE